MTSNAAYISTGRTSIVELSKVSLTYPGPPAVPVLKTINLQIFSGDYVTVVGPSGSGKSTFLNVLGLLDTPTAGSYSLSGLDTGGLNDNQKTALRGHRIGFVFQAFHLMDHRTATENVELAMLYNGTPRKARRRLAQEALSRVGLSHRLDSLPTRLSGGERQRVAIARAVVTQPDLLLCDEPTGNLDSKTAGTVLELLDELHTSGHTLVVITHDPRVADRGLRQLAIKDGELSETMDVSAAQRSG